jgi:hypothetical protein
MVKFIKDILSLTISKVSIKKFVFIGIFSLTIFSTFQLSLAQNAETVNGTIEGIVSCGNATGTENRCRIDDLFSLGSRFASYIISVIFPALFFFGLYMTLWPLIKDPNSSANRTQAKQNGMKLLMGTAFVLGAYLIIQSILASLGFVDTGIFKKTVNTSTSTQTVSFMGIEKAYAEGDGSFVNPLTTTSVQNVLGGLVNMVTFIAVLGIIYGLIRGVMYLMLGQENPENIKKGKTWIVWTLAIAAVVFGAQTLLSLISNTATGVFGPK